MAKSAIALRAAVDGDFDAITAIYAGHVERGTASFELAAPDGAEMRRRWREVISGGLPYIVATQPPGAAIVGYAYASPYRARPAYRFTVEDSVYVDASSMRRGAGRALLAAIIAACEPLGYRQMIAVIGGSDNAASIALHAALGFEQAGCLTSVGRKFERWIDTVLMQRALSAGATTAPR